MIEVKESTNSKERKLKGFISYIKCVVVPGLWATMLLIFLAVLMLDGGVYKIVSLITDEVNVMLSFIENEQLRLIVFLAILLIGGYSFFKYVDYTAEDKNKEN